MRTVRPIRVATNRHLKYQSIQQQIQDSKNKPASYYNQYLLIKEVELMLKLYKRKNINNSILTIINYLMADLSEYETIVKKIKQEQRPLKAYLQNKCGFARTLTVNLPHGEVLTPVYMPVGTKGVMKGITSQQMENLDCRIMLSNTYHLGTKPGSQFLADVGGLHKFMGWNRNILTDSGGFQMVSLGKLCEITEQGVKFQSPYDQSQIFIRPQDSIGFQNCIGSDIMMALDDVVKTTTIGPRMEQAMHRTIRWISRNIQGNKNPERQTLFPIIQGGIDPELRKKCLEQLIKTDASGFAIGGLSGGEAKKDFFRTVRQCCQALPPNKPRYLMGVGYPVDLALGVALGVDMFDCVFPTRTARFGTAFTSYGEIKLRSKAYAKDFSPIEQGCQCQACTHFTKAYLHMIEKHDNFCHLLSMHNVNFLFNLMKKLRKAIQTESVPQFLKTFLNNIYTQQKKIPDWVEYALQLAKIDIKLDYPFYQTDEKLFQGLKEGKIEQQ